jgi:hypothetical protein
VNAARIAAVAVSGALKATAVVAGVSALVSVGVGAVVDR